MKTKYDKHGALHVNIQGNLVDYTGVPVPLIGVDSNVLSLSPQEINREYFQKLQKDYAIDIIRLSVSADADVKDCLNTLHTCVTSATELGLYLIIHCIHKNAHSFFEAFASKYYAYGNLLYEISSVPEEIYESYTKEFIQSIRKIDPYGIIILGGSTEHLKGFKNVVSDIRTLEDVEWKEIE